MATYNKKPWLKWYDQSVPSEIKTPDISYIDMLDKGINRNPDHPAFYFLGKTITFKDLDRLSCQFSAWLSKVGCKKGDVIGINLPNVPQYPIALIGSIRSGLIVTGVSPLLTHRELIHHLNDSGAKIIVTMDLLFEEKLAQVADKVPGLKNIVVTNIADFLSPIKKIIGTFLKKIPTGKVTPLPGKDIITFKKLLAENAPVKPKVSVKPNDTMMLQYTGGTTGPSKGTELTHQNIVANNLQVMEWVNDRPKTGPGVLDYAYGKDMICSGFPFFHMAGLALCLQNIAFGCTQILVPDPRNTDLICKDIRKYRPNILVNVPTLYQMLLANPMFKTLDFSDVKFALSAAAPLDLGTIKALEEMIGENKVVEAYGMTETSPILAMNPLKGKKKNGSVGIPVQGVDIKIVDTANGTTEVPIGEPGELIVKGPQVMKGYLNKPEETQNAIRDFGDEGKYLYTGDILRMDEDGFLYVVDRSKDMLLVGGYNVYSKELEDTLYELPDIDLCAIVGEENPERPGSDLVKAVIQLTPSSKNRVQADMEKKILNFCREHLSPYKVPRKIQFVDEMPLTNIGKVDKKELRPPK